MNGPTVLSRQDAANFALCALWKPYFFRVKVESEVSAWQDVKNTSMTITIHEEMMPENHLLLGHRLLISKGWCRRIEIGD